MQQDAERTGEDRVSRREFIRRATLASGAAALAGCVSGDETRQATEGSTGTLPRRPLGRTGEEVPILGMGSATAGKHRTPEEAAALYDEAIDLGVTYMDTAPDFAGYGKAQRALGEVLAKRRDEVFLVTKCWEPRGDDARRLLENNLRELRTDHADLVYAHSVGSDKMDPEVVQAKGGVLEFLQKAKEEGLTRFAGISGHNRPGRFVDILERFPVDVMMCAVNFVDRHTYDFETRVYPVAARQGVALVAMKILGGERGGSPRCMCPRAYHDLAFRYALGLPDLSLVVVGMNDRQELLENVERLASYRPLTEEERAALREAGSRLSGDWGAHFGPVT